MEGAIFQEVRFIADIHHSMLFYIASANNQRIEQRFDINPAARITYAPEGTSKHPARMRVYHLKNTPAVVIKAS